ncbi:DUF3298/DUF4163 domain-containing protein [Pseudoflavonifractor sp. AF19-9AC]|uniref:DUF3298 and DUF4163 domain-containing protein n=1 Tax=Pseudoflavonifractor sp. AF19-9AC TaxID=2292244 RepID=UPI000E498D84|nr:DUF3298 and DUF4163 domain-containing protein [Pseudoflavonifractor sp. AF19-9AC]RHR04656.1 DUF3298/DUF4163 domain-containing protein [Pseudoflavonifractor sp. AF19-9AC]
MNLDEELRRRALEHPPTPSQSFSRRVEDTLFQLSVHPPRRRRRWRPFVSVVSAAAVLALVILPNSNAAMATALGQLPVVGSLFQAVTFRTYSGGEGGDHASVSIPQIVGEGDSSGAQQINEEIRQYADQLIAEFERESNADGYFNLDVTWEVVTNTDRWFTLRINSDRVMASGNHQEQHYHIDVQTGQRKTLSDLFPEDFDYVTAISSELKEQMHTRMEQDSREVYWLKDTSQLGTYYFDAIDPEQDFYFDSQGHLVIPFDKYEVGPGSTGSPEFTLLSPQLYEQLLYRP